MATLKVWQVSFSIVMPLEAVDGEVTYGRKVILNGEFHFSSAFGEIGKR